MRRRMVAALCAACLSLTGCGGSPWSNYRALEELLPVQTMGFDRREEQMLLTVAAPGDSPDSNTLLSAPGETVAAAAETLRNRGRRQELFFPQVRFALVGPQAARQGLEEIFDWFAHSGRTRLDLPLWILREGSAQELILGGGTADTGITGALEALQRHNRAMPTLLDTARQLRRTGAAACPVLTVVTEGDTLLPRADGFAVLRPDGLADYLTEEESLGTALLLGRRDSLALYPEEGILTVRPLRLSHRWEGRRLEVVLHYAGRLSQAPEGAETALEAAVNDHLAACLSAALDRAAAWEADFLNVTRDGVFPAGATWNITVRGKLLPPAGREAQA